MEDTGLTFGAWFSATLSTEEMLAKMIQELYSVLPKDGVKCAKALKAWLEESHLEEAHGTEIEGLFDEVLGKLNEIALPDMYIGENEAGTVYGYWPIWGDYLYETERLTLDKLIAQSNAKGEDYAISNLIGMTYRTYLQSNELPVCDVQGNPWLMLFQRFNSEEEVIEIWAASDGGAYYGLWERGE